MAWASAPASAPAEGPKYDMDYYRSVFKRQTSAPKNTPDRMALVGKENTAKTGLALSMREGRTFIFDFDNSAEATVDYVCRDAKGKRDEDVIILRIFDELDESIFNDDNSTNWLALVDKVSWFVNLVAEEAKEGNVGTVIFDGGSTFMKWCEFAMRDSLVRRGIIGEVNDTFNQKEWQERNRMFRDTVSRVHSLPVPKIFFTFHLKDHKSYIPDGGGRKVLSKIGEKVDWVDGTQRIVSQQIFLGRYMKKEDDAAGVRGDDSLDDGVWEIRATIEEMKGKGSEHVGSTHTILQVKDGNVQWNGLPDLGL